MADFLTPVERKLKEKQEQGEEVAGDIEVPELSPDPDGPNPGAEPGEDKSATEPSVADASEAPSFYNREAGDVDGSSV